MKCPNCQAEISSDAAFCRYCGAKLAQPAAGSSGSGPVQSADRPDSGSPASGTVTRAYQPVRQDKPREAAKAAELASNTGFALGRAARQARIEAVVDEDAVISPRAYNSVIMGVLLWGLVVNYVLCSVLSKTILNVSPTVILIGYPALAIPGTIISMKSSNPWISFLGYNMVVVPLGLVISFIVEAFGGMQSEVVAYAFMYTMLIAVGMFACYLIAPGFFAKLGGALLALLGGLLLCEVVLLIFGVDQIATDWIAAGLFSLYIGYDLYRSQKYPKTLDNAVDSALDIYLDIANLFLRLLRIIAASKRND